jgi:integrase
MMASELMMEGLPMPIIQKQLGHASLATTERYLLHIAPRELIEAMNSRRLLSRACWLMR